MLATKNCKKTLNNSKEPLLNNVVHIVLSSIRNLSTSSGKAVVHATIQACLLPYNQKKRESYALARCGTKGNATGTS